MNKITTAVLLLVATMATSALGRGHLLWDSNGADNSQETACALSDGGIAIVSSEGLLYRLSASGDTLWKTKLDSSVASVFALVCENGAGEIIVVADNLFYNPRWNPTSKGADSMNYRYYGFDRHGKLLAERKLEVGWIGLPIRVLILDFSLVVIFSKQYGSGSGDVICTSPDGELNIIKIDYAGSLSWNRTYHFENGFFSFSTQTCFYNGECGLFLGLCKNNSDICLIVDAVEGGYSREKEFYDRQDDPYGDFERNRPHYGKTRADSLNFRMIILNQETGADSTVWLHNWRDFFDVAPDGAYILNRWPFDLLIKDGRNGRFFRFFTPHHMNKDLMEWVEDPQHFQVFNMNADYTVSPIADFRLDSAFSFARDVLIPGFSPKPGDNDVFIFTGHIKLKDPSEWANTVFVEQVSLKGEDWIWRHGRSNYEEEPVALLPTKDHIYLLGNRHNPPGLGIPEYQNWIVKLSY